MLSLCFVHWRATRRVLASVWGLRVHFYTRRVLIFKAGITVILCLVFIFRRIRRGIFNILLPGAVPPPLATCLNILLEYISQYRRAVRADRNGIRIRFCENLLHSRGNTHMLPSIRIWINVRQLCSSYKLTLVISGENMRSV